MFEAQYDWRNANLSIPTDLFRNEEKNKSGDIGTGILDVFDRYNFTIKEDEPLDKEVAVDPEMLGKVFENMLEIKERKSKGAFYTPREIVHYMCQESLIHYLDNAVNQNNKTVITKEDIEQYIREGHLALENDVRVAERGETKTYQFQLPESIRNNADIIDKKLTEIRICDPAIGSGAFPVGLLHELVTAQLVLKPHLSYDYLNNKLKAFDFKERESVSESRYVYRLKKHIIQESIYGVDIDRSAIDIARLRLWLSLVVDEDDLEPIETLPNLDYKIVCGNSLIGMPENSFRDLKVEEELEVLKEEFYSVTDEKRKKELRHNINKKIRELLDSVEQFAGYKIDFDFKLFFSEVWREQGGFDVVIGNPPYLQIQYLPDEEKEILKKNKYEVFSLRGDLYELFYERGNLILKNDGHLCFITSNKWLRANYGKSTRNYFLDKVNPKILYDFGQEMVFSTAIVHSNVFLFQNSNYNNSFFGVAFEAEDFKSLNLTEYFIKNKIKLDYKKDDVWSITSPKLTQIKNKIEKIGTKLANWDNKITRGIITGLNEAFIIDEEQYVEFMGNPENGKILKKIVRGRDTRKYYCNDSNKWMIISGFNENQKIKNSYPDIFQYLQKFEIGLKKRGQVQNGQHHWLELDNTPSKKFFLQFEEPKIIFSEIVSEPQFCYETEKLYPEATSFFLVGDNLKWLCAFLNSELITVVFRIFYAGGELVGKYRYKKTFLNSLPIPKPSSDGEKILNNLVDYLSFYKSTYNDNPSEICLSNYFELIIDALVYQIIFNSEFKAANKSILKHLADLKPITDDMSDEEKLGIIQSEYERLYHPEHPVRFVIETLDSIEEVRIIREALKQ